MKMETKSIGLSKSSSKRKFTVKQVYSQETRKISSNLNVLKNPENEEWAKVSEYEEETIKIRTEINRNQKKGRKKIKNWLSER